MRQGRSLHSIFMAKKRYGKGTGDSLRNPYLEKWLQRRENAIRNKDRMINQLKHNNEEIMLQLKKLSDEITQNLLQRKKRKPESSHHSASNQHLLQSRSLTESSNLYIVRRNNQLQSLGKLSEICEKEIKFLRKKVEKLESYEVITEVEQKVREKEELTILLERKREKLERETVLHEKQITKYQLKNQANFADRGESERHVNQSEIDLELKIRSSMYKNTELKRRLRELELNKEQKEKFIKERENKINSERENMKKRELGLNKSFAHAHQRSASKDTNSKNKNTRSTTPNNFGSEYHFEIPPDNNRLQQIRTKNRNLRENCIIMAQYNIEIKDLQDLIIVLKGELGIRGKEKGALDHKVNKFERILKIQNMLKYSPRKIYKTPGQIKYLQLRKNMQRFSRLKWKMATSGEVTTRSLIVNIEETTTPRVNEEKAEEKAEEMTIESELAPNPFEIFITQNDRMDYAAGPNEATID